MRSTPQIMIVALFLVTLVGCKAFERTHETQMLAGAREAQVAALTLTHAGMQEGWITEEQAREISRFNDNVVEPTLVRWRQNLGDEDAQQEALEAVSSLERMVSQHADQGD